MSDGRITIKQEQLLKSRERIDALNAEARAMAAEQPREAFQMAERIRNQATEIFYKKGLADSLGTLALTHQLLTNFADSLSCALEAQELFQELGDMQGEASVLNTLGAIYNHLGDYENRLKCNLNCLHLRIESGDRQGEVGTLNNIGDTYMAMGDYDNALTYFEHCLTLDHIPLRTRCIVTYNIGEVHFHNKHIEKAMGVIEESLDLARETGYTIIEVVAQNQLGRGYLKLGQPAKGLPLLEKALEVIKSRDVNYYIDVVYETLAKTYDALGQLDKAYQYFKLFYEAKEEMYNEANLRRIKNIQFQHEVRTMQQATEVEREKNRQLKLAFDKIELQNQEIRQQNEDIRSSIRYARQIQTAMLPDSERFEKAFKESFVFYLPRDIVSGDFYWMGGLSLGANRIAWSAADCTGHGVPGAFVSITGINYLELAATERDVKTPGQALDFMHRKISGTLNHSADDQMIHDGMDMAICTYDAAGKMLQFAGAKNPVYIVRIGGEVKAPKGGRCHQSEAYPDRVIYELKGDKQAIGDASPRGRFCFADQQFQIQDGDGVFLFTDGITDQFGGLRGKKFMHRQFRELLLRIAHLPMAEQRKTIAYTLHHWMHPATGKTYDQVDDILVMGVRL